MVFAGIWESWEAQEGKETIKSWTILTTEAAEPVVVLHDRMPVIMGPENFDLWLDQKKRRVEKLHDLIGSTMLGTLAIYRVSKYVNKAFPFRFSTAC